MTENGDHYRWIMAEPNIRKCVLLLKAPNEEEEDPYIHVLEGAGFDPVLVPVLSFRFVNQEELAEELQNSDRLSGIIFTSPRAVQAASKAISLIQDNTPRFDASLLRCFVVGKATANAAKAAGFRTEGAESGSGEYLADFIINQRNSEDTRPLLYPCASIRRDTLLDRLHDAECKTKEIVAYETHASETLEKDITSVIKTKGLPDMVVFFSPSGVQFTVHLVQKGLLPVCKLKVYALGPSTHQALLGQGYQVSGIADKPEPTSLLKLLQEEDGKDTA